MRIWYQSLFDGGRMPAYYEGLKERAKQVARQGTPSELLSDSTLKRAYLGI
jgi:hypothetical protein